MAFVVIAISGLNCEVNQLDKQFIYSHIVATGLSLHCVQCCLELQKLLGQLGSYSSWTDICKFRSQKITNRSLTNIVSSVFTSPLNSHELEVWFLSLSVVFMEEILSTSGKNFFCQIYGLASTTSPILSVMLV